MHVVLIEPEIPGNTGSIARTCAGTGTSLHLVGKLGFSLEDKYLKRAGLDYWPEVDVHRHPDFESVLKAVPNGTVWLFAKRAEKTLWDVSFGPDDLLVFGCETRGLPTDIQETYANQKLRIPITEGIRSLNLANAATVAIYEGLRQIGWSAPPHNL